MDSRALAGTGALLPAPHPPSLRGCPEAEAPLAAGGRGLSVPGPLWTSHLFFLSALVSRLGLWSLFRPGAAPAESCFVLAVFVWMPGWGDSQAESAYFKGPRPWGHPHPNAGGFTDCLSLSKPEVSNAAGWGTDLGSTLAWQKACRWVGPSPGCCPLPSARKGGSWSAFSRYDPPGPCK